VIAYVVIGVAAAVVVAIILAVPGTRPRIRRWPWLVALAFVVAFACAGVYYVHHMWDDLAGVRLGPPVH
jgi:energy-converting hydrogenase Eha subunit A